MKLVLRKEEKTKLKTADEHFKSCPACGEKELIKVSPEVLCATCDWGSMAWSISRGVMDNPFSAAMEFDRAEIKYRKRTAVDRQKQTENFEIETSIGDAS